VLLEVPGVAQIVSSGGKPAPVVTVAELMRRCTPAPELGDDGAPIPVAALLRREGRSATGLPAVQPPAVGEVLSTLPARQPLLRRGAMAAGALLAAGSVFGLTSAMNAPVTPPTSSGTFPDQAEPGGSGSPAVLDAGQAAPSTWLPVAFPTLFPEANAPQAAAPRAAAPQAPVQQPVAAPVRAASGGGAAQQANSAPATTAPRSTATKKDSGGVVSDTVDAVGGTVREVGKDTPLKDVTDTVGGTVSGVGRQVGAITDPITNPITTPLTTTVKSVVAPLTAPLTTGPSPTSTPSTTSKPTSSAKPSTSSAPTGVATSAAKGLLGG
jgi:hypothetical protein